jgi:hypothetical protein
MSYHWEQSGEHMGTWGASLGTLWEQDESTMGTKKFPQKISKPPASPTSKKVNGGASWVHIEPPHWLHEILIFYNLFDTIFNLG